MPMQMSKKEIELRQQFTEKKKKLIKSCRREMPKRLVRFLTRPRP